MQAFTQSFTTVLARGGLDNSWTYKTHIKQNIIQNIAKETSRYNVLIIVIIKQYNGILILVQFVY